MLPPDLKTASKPWSPTMKSTGTSYLLWLLCLAASRGVACCHALWRSGVPKAVPNAGATAQFRCPW